MVIDKSINIPEWNEDIKQKIISFWENRRVVFYATDGDKLEGKRGNIWGNLTSFDMSKLMTKLTISRASPVDFTCSMHVNTIMQDITEWNKAYWQYEMDTLESWLLHDDMKVNEWEEYSSGAREASVKWVVSGRSAGRKFPPK